MTPKSSPEAIYLGGGLVVGGLLESLGINDNKIISGIPNFIPSDKLFSLSGQAVNARRSGSQY